MGDRLSSEPGMSRNIATRKIYLKSGPITIERKQEGTMLNQSVLVLKSFFCVGGETVKDINRQSGAWVELSRDRPPNPHDRVFKINGMPDQIQHAIRLICEKAGLVCFLYLKNWPKTQ